MVCVSKTALLLQGLFVLSARASDSTSTGQLTIQSGRKDAADAAKTFFADKPNDICGGGQIQAIFLDVPNEVSFRSSKWSKVQATAKAYLESVVVEINKLTAEAERLEQEIEIAIEKSAPMDWDINDGAKLLLEEVLTEAFGSPETAKAVQCGQAARDIRKKHGVRAGAYKKARAAMQEKLPAVFEGGKIRVGDKKGDDQRLLGMCGDLVGWNPEASGDDGSYCDELCQSFARTSLDLSAKQAGSYAGASVKELEAKLAQVKADLRYNNDEEDECKRVTKALFGFTTLLENLNADIEVKNKLRMDAKDALEDAEEELEDMEGEHEGLSNTLATRQKDLGLTTDKAQQMVLMLAQEKAKEKEAKQAVQNALDHFNTASDELERAAAASISADTIRGLVTETMLKMVAYYEVTVARPLQSLRFPLETDISEFFKGIQDQASLEREEMRVTLKYMDKYCQNTALKAFQRVESSIDVKSLCPEGGTQDIAGQIAAMVTQRAGEVQAALEKVQSSLDVYADQDGMSKQESDRLTSLGELEGLREVATTYGKSNYFTKYLAHWKLDAEPPRFIDLLASLNNAVDRLIEQEALAKKALEDAVTASEQQLEKRKQVANLLKEAVANNEIAKGKEAEAQSEVEAQDKLIAAKEADLSKLQAALDAAEKAFRDAKELLKSTYKRGASME